MDVEIKTYHCDSCPAYCKIEKEGDEPPKNICIETGENLDNANDTKGWYPVE